MWEAQTENLPDRAGQKIKLANNGRIPSYADVIELWRHDDQFRTFFNSLLINAPFEAYRWETPAVTASNLNRKFEFVLLDCPGLLTTPDPHAFESYFASDGARDHIVTFANLGKDATLVVPLPMQPDSSYAHLAAFMRTAPQEQTHALWRTVGDAMQRRISQKPVWLSTAGMGVSWLHVRLDDRPKYYGHAPYRSDG
jgi:Family of unknown function (DUF6940)